MWLQIAALETRQEERRTADMLVREILSRKLRDRRAVARYAGLTGSPDESGLKRREKGLAKDPKGDFYLAVGETAKRTHHRWESQEAGSAVAS